MRVKPVVPNAADTSMIIARNAQGSARNVRMSAGEWQLDIAIVNRVEHRLQHLLKNRNVISAY
jgi:hypothetical protein